MKIIDINGNERQCLTAASDPAYPGFIKVVYESKREPGQQFTEWYPQADFLAKNPDLKNVAGTTPPPKEVVGTVTKAKKLSLTDSKQKWLPNQYIDFPVWISRGKGEGQTRTITENSHNQLTIDSEWEVIPDTSSQFVISKNVHNPQPQGNELPNSQEPS